MKVSWKHLFVSSTALRTPHSFWKSVQAPESILWMLNLLSNLELPNPSNRRNTCPANMLGQQQLKKHQGLNRFFCCWHCLGSVKHSVFAVLSVMSVFNTGWEFGLKSTWAAPGELFLIKHLAGDWWQLQGDLNSSRAKCGEDLNWEIQNHGNGFQIWGRWALIWKAKFSHD